jgi:polysaccharide biosynthesis transport protein
MDRSAPLQERRMKNRELADPPTLVRMREQIPEDDDIRLGDYLHVLWVRRVLVLGCALVIGGLVAAQTLLGGRTYEATLMMAVNQSKIGDSEAATIAASNFRPLIENHGIADAIITEFKLDRPPLELTRTEFLSQVLWVEELRNTSLLQLRVRLADPELAAKVANRVAEKAVDLARRLSQDEAVQARDYIKIQLDEAGKRLTEAEQQLSARREVAQIDLLKKDVASLLDERAELMKVEVKLAGARAKLQRAEEELTKRQRTQMLHRSIETDPAMMEAARAVQGSGTAPAPPSVLGLQLRSEFVDEVFVNIDDLAAKSRTEVADLEKQRAQLAGSGGELKVTRLPQLTELYKRETEVARLETDYELAKRVYMDVANRYQGARLQVAARSAQLQVIDAALPPNGPLPRRLVSRTAMGTIIGLVIGVLAAFVREAIRNAEQRRATA